MPPIKRVITGKMNSDASNELMPPEDFRDGLNVTIDTDGIVSINGNRRFTDSYLAAGYWCAGAHYDKTRRRVYLFLAHENQRNRIVICHLDVEATVTLYENLTDSDGVDILEWDMPATWTAAKVIKNINVVHRDFGGDLLYFLDPLKRPLKVNVDTMIANGYGDQPTLNMWKVIKTPPLTVPTCYYANEPGRTINNLKKKLFMFTVQFVYDDDEKSVWGPKSKIPLPPQADDGEYYADGTKANVIKITVPTGIKTVTKINIAARVNVNSVWSDYFLIDTLDKEALSIGDNEAYEYKFFNDGAYNFIDVEEANQLFDYVPDEANTQELVNGNVLVYAGIKEGQDKEVTLDIDVETGTEIPSVATLFYNIVNDTPRTFLVTFSGTPSTGDTVRLQFNYDNSGTPVIVDYLYTVSGGDTIDTIIDYFVTQINTNHGSFIQAFNRTSPENSLEVSSVSVFDILYNLVVTITTSSAPSATDSGSVFKWKGRYKASLHYSTNDGKTRGVYNAGQALTIDMPAYSEDGSGNALTPYVELSINHAPPTWADRYHVVLTKELTALRALFILTQAVAEDTDYAYISIKNLATHIEKFPASEQIINYEFTPGDRIRFLENNTTNTVLTSLDYEILGVVDYTISATVHSCIKVKKVTGMPSFGTTATRFYIELFTPAPAVVSNEENFFYEIGESYVITTDANGNRVHAGGEQNQIIGGLEQPAKIKLTSGDYYFRVRNLTVEDSGTLVDYQCMDMHFSDFWQSAVWSQGRPLVIDESIREQYYPALFRYSLSYVYGTNINNLSRFYADNFEEANVDYGDVLNLKIRENQLRIFQRFKTGVMPVLRSILLDTAGSSNVALSERVLNKINYYAGDYGIDQYGLSLVSTDYGDYFLDDINRAFVRASLDGITNVSDTFQMRKFFNENVGFGYTAHGVFDYERREVLMSIVTDEDEFTKLVRFSEMRKGFQPRYSFADAEKMLFVEGILWSMKPVAWVHDNEDYCTFFGEETAPFITVVFNGGVDFKKNFTNAYMISNRVWGIKDILTSLDQESELKTQDFVQREDKYVAALLRDANSEGGLSGGKPLKGNWLQATFIGGPESSLDGEADTEVSVSQKYSVTLLAVTFTESNLNKR